MSTCCRAVTRRAQRRALRRAERRVVVRRHQQRQRGRIGRAARAAVAQHRDAAMRHDGAAHVTQAGGGAAQPVADVVQLVAHLCRVQTAVKGSGISRVGTVVCGCTNGFRFCLKGPMIAVKTHIDCVRLL